MPARAILAAFLLLPGFAGAETAYFFTDNGYGIAVSAMHNPGAELNHSSGMAIRAEDGAEWPLPSCTESTVSVLLSRLPTLQSRFRIDTGGRPHRA